MNISLAFKKKIKNNKEEKLEDALDGWLKVSKVQPSKKGKLQVVKNDSFKNEMDEIN